MRNSRRLIVTIASLLIGASIALVQAASTSKDARAFVEAAEQELLELGEVAARAAWVRANFITGDTMAIAEETETVYSTAAVRIATESARFKDLRLDADTRRKLDLLGRALTLPTPADEAKTSELVGLSSSMSARYAQGKYCREDGSCPDLTAMVEVMANSRDPEELLDLWQGWRQVSPPMRAEYARMVEIANEGSRALGYADTGAFWRSGYDMPQENFAAEEDRLWGQVKPLYDALHCHVRASLGEQYGTDIVPADEPIPAHLLGNMWAQDWATIYPMAAPENADPGFDLTEQILASGMDEVAMMRTGEGFFTSLGFDPLPDSFWERSLITKPRDREVVCHASAWSIDGEDDIRVKMCTQKTADDFQTIHHELGHSFYQRAYKTQSHVYRNGANDGFHEAIGDTIALSMTPAYLKQLKLIEDIPDASKDIGLLLQQAMTKVAFLPFGLLVDKWRWQVFSGETTPASYNADWWKLRTNYQGIQPPVARSEADFDPGAKSHIPSSTPYARYFLAHILQFQFHQALCEISGFEGPLHRCTIYGNKKAGARLGKMLEMGASKPWPEALAAVTGTRKMDAGPILEYFAPLKVWLDEQNQGRQCGW